jgi:CRISPR-associated protein Csx10
MHIRVDPESGRVEEGQLFEYEALEAGQYFAGELTCTDEEAWELLQTLANLEEEAAVELRLGKATRRGYGKVTLWLEPWGDDKPPVWVQQPIAERVDEGADELTLTLLTDAVVTDAWGRFVTGFDETCRCGKDQPECRCRCEWLSDALGFDVRVVEGRDFAATHRLDGFNTQLRLPRWRDVALRAGSTARLKVLEEPKGGLLEALARIERKGIGQRRNEGYGRVAFDHPLHDDHEALSGTKVTIPGAIDLGIREKTEEKARMEFREDWDKALDDTSWDSCQKPAFAGLARWLEARRHEPIGKLIEKMEALGEPDELLIEQLGGAAERGDREIANPLTEEKGFKLVKKLLKRLQGKDEAHQPLGVRMLADRLAEAAERKEGGR